MKEGGYKTDRGWKFTDLYDFTIVSHSPADLKKVRDDYVGAFKPTSTDPPHPSGLGTIPQGQQSQAQNQTSARGLTIKIAATHAGLITRNNGFYMPDKMRAAVDSWTSSYPKPIQIHHNDSPGDSQDPVGRVIAARYVDTSGPTISQFQNSVLRDSFNNEVGRADEVFWKKFISDRTAFIDKVNMIRLMDSVLSDPNNHGVGYIELTANIADPDAIQKILDGRYLTGSVGAVSDKAVCSVCSTDWLEEEHCGHRPGRIYDGKKCIVIAGNLEYDEYSFVNTPADRHSGVLSIQNSVITDSTDGSIKFFPTFSDKEASIMSDTTTTTQIQDSAESVTTTNIPVERKEDAVQDATLTPSIAADLVAMEADQELNTLLDKLFAGTELTEQEQDKLYEFQLSEMDKEVIEDAKLSSSKRKKLSSSTFCGPGRSFPVPDCAHVTAARRLIGRYKGNKDGILACVSRKAKALGCGGGKDSVTTEVATPVKDNVQEVVQTQPQEHIFDFSMKQPGDLTDEVKKNLAKEFVQRFIDSALGKDVLVEALAAKGLVATIEDMNAVCAEVAKNEDIIGELRDQLSALRKELKASYDDMILVEDQLIKSKEEALSSKVERVKLYHKATGTLTDAVVKNLETLSSDVLDSTIKDLATKFDTEKIADRLNSGLSRTPEETVTVPAGLTEPSAETQPTNKPTFATQQMVDQVYSRIFITEGNPAKAKAYYDEMVKRGFAAPKNN